MARPGSDEPQAQTQRPPSPTEQAQKPTSARQAEAASTDVRPDAAALQSFHDTHGNQSALAAARGDLGADAQEVVRTGPQSDRGWRPPELAEPLIFDEWIEDGTIPASLASVGVPGVEDCADEPASVQDLESIDLDGDLDFDLPEEWFQDGTVPHSVLDHDEVEDCADEPSADVEAMDMADSSEAGALWSGAPALPSSGPLPPTTGLLPHSTPPPQSRLDKLIADNTHACSPTDIDGNGLDDRRESEQNPWDPYGWDPTSTGQTGPIIPQVSAARDRTIPLPGPRDNQDSKESPENWKNPNWPTIWDYGAEAGVVPQELADNPMSASPFTIPGKIDMLAAPITAALSLGSCEDPQWIEKVMAIGSGVIEGGEFAALGRGGAQAARTLDDSQALFSRRPSFDAMPKERLERIKNGFGRATGGAMDDGAESVRYLDYKGAEGATLNAETILLRPDTSPGTVFEEIIHSTQFRKGHHARWVERWGNGGAAAISEYEAAQKLVRAQRAYGISDAEHLVNIRRVKQFEKELQSLGVPLEGY